MLTEGECDMKNPETNDFRMVTRDDLGDYYGATEEERTTTRRPISALAIASMDNFLRHSRPTAVQQEVHTDINTTPAAKTAFEATSTDSIIVGGQDA